MKPAAVLHLFTCVMLLEHSHGSDWWKAYMKGMQLQKAMREFEEFPDESIVKTHDPDHEHEALKCQDMFPSRRVPTSVHRVKPADVKVIAALGDSITAGAGANASRLEDLLIENRELSWSIGGYRGYMDVVTLPNIFRLFNPDIVGAAENWTVIKQEAPLETTGFNLAVSGANTYHLPEQARHLIDTMKKHPDVNFEKDWKVVTIFIGANDLCDYCSNKTLYSADSYVHNITVALDLLNRELPRTIVNMVQLFRMEGLRKANDGSMGCQLQKQFCPCLILPADDSNELKEVLTQNEKFQEKLEELIGSGRYDKKKHFTVVLQPFLKKAQLPKKDDGSIDFSYFSVDCFHFSLKGHEQLASALWNNMLEPEGEKFQLDVFSVAIQLNCPSQMHPYIYTRKSLACPTVNGSYSILLLILILELGIW